MTMYQDMQMHVLQMQTGESERIDLPQPELPQNIAPVPRPPVEELKAQRETSISSRYTDM